MLQSPVYHAIDGCNTGWHLADRARVEVAMLVLIQFDGDKIAHEHGYCDEASVLAQVGLLKPGGLPVVDAEAARAMLDRSIRFDGLITAPKDADPTAVS